APEVSRVVPVRRKIGHCGMTDSTRSAGTRPCTLQPDTTWDSAYLATASRVSASSRRGKEVSSPLILLRQDVVACCFGGTLLLSAYLCCDCITLDQSLR